MKKHSLFIIVLALSALTGCGYKVPTTDFNKVKTNRLALDLFCKRIGNTISSVPQFPQRSYLVQLLGMGGTPDGLMPWQHQAELGPIFQRDGWTS